MRILIVCSGNADRISPFILEQVDSLRKLHAEIDFFIIKGKGIIGYLKNYYKLRTTLKEIKPEVIHAHYGLSSMLAVLQFKKPLVITLHGSDTHILFNNLISIIVTIFADYSIIVEEKLLRKLKLKPKTNYSIIPCGINLAEFKPTDKLEAQITLKLNPKKKNILFSSSFENKIKNYPLAKEAIKLVDEEIELLELKNKDRYEVNLLLNACDLLLLTSLAEGSPQIIKEAMACNCPIVSTDVGDVKEVIGDTEGCYITSFVPNDVAEKIEKAIDLGKRTNGREKIGRFDNMIIAEKIYKIYKKVTKV